MPLIHGCLVYLFFLSFLADVSVNWSECRSPDVKRFGGYWSLTNGIELIAFRWEGNTGPGSSGHGLAVIHQSPSPTTVYHPSLLLSASSLAGGCRGGARNGLALREWFCSPYQ
ncbi:hypothetical protein LY76DRAFT_590915 [Colletotrichum caudatum]|nr:hypothetical protein LY76DRAFT_590915 [Colletotrichum caudatum]